jgi:murein L,D-transpeptidase YafK
MQRIFITEWKKIWRTGYDEVAMAYNLPLYRWKCGNTQVLIDRLSAGQVLYQIHLKIMVKPISMTGIKMNLFIPYTDRHWKYKVVIKCKISDGKRKVCENTAVGKIWTNDWRHHNFIAL